MTSTFRTRLAATVGISVIALFFVFGNPFNATNSLSQIGAPAGTEQLIVQDEVIGTGATAFPGDTVRVNYTGKLQNGTVFDTSFGRGPYEFILGSGVVIPGWDQGLVGMKVGGKRLLIIPPHLAYGAEAYGPIPSNSTLVFEVTLLEVTSASANLLPEVEETE